MSRRGERVGGVRSGQRAAASKRTGQSDASDRDLISASELARRWAVAPNTAHRIAKREGFLCYCLGGKGGTVRYSLKSVIEYEESCRV